MSAYRRQDGFYRRAKVSGARSRATFKLAELARGLLRPGDRVVDLGAWPGGWMKLTAEQVGPSGRVVGVDLRPIDPLGTAWARALIGDVDDEETLVAIERELEGPADVVLSDLAPKLTGIRDRDDAACERLVNRSLTIAVRFLRPGGSFLCKAFQRGVGAFEKETRLHFEDVRKTRPEATRKESAEIYVVARRLRSPGGSGSST